MKNHNGNIFRSHLELFNGGSWGVYGGVGFILVYEAEGFTSFLGKIPIFKAIWGAIMRGVGIHCGAQEGRWIHIWGVFYLQKRDFFYLDVCLSMEMRRPPMNWFWKYQNIICDHQPEYKIIKFRLLLMFLQLQTRSYTIFSYFWHLELLPRARKILTKSQNMWYEYNFLMSIKYSFEFMKFVSYKTEERMRGRHGIYWCFSVLNSASNFIMVISFPCESSLTKRPPIRPSILYDTNFINSKQNI